MHITGRRAQAVETACFQGRKWTWWSRQGSQDDWCGQIEGKEGEYKVEKREPGSRALQPEQALWIVLQWLRIHLPMQGTWVQALVREDLTCHGATKPVSHNYWACAPEPASHNYWAHVPQQLKPGRLEPVLPNEKPLQWEAHAPQRRVAPTRRN